jgi:hypothetical protein
MLTILPKKVNTQKKKKKQKLTTNQMFVDFTHTTHLIVSIIVAWT